MNIATRNGSIIVKDGAVAENCDCCGGWYCDATSCYRCDLGPFPSICIPNWDPSCTASINCKTMVGGPGCQGTPLSVSVSGFSADGFFNTSAIPQSRDIEPWFDLLVLDGPLGFPAGEFKPTEVSQFNGTYDVSEVCGYSGVGRILSSDGLGFSSRFGGGSLVIGVGYSNAGPSGAPACGTGTVALRISLNLQLLYNRAGSTGAGRLLMSGSHSEPCVTIDSLPNAGSFLAGKSLQVTAGGTMSNPVTSHSTTKTISLSFS